MTSPIVPALRKLSNLTSKPSSLSLTTTHTEVIDDPPRAKKFLFNNSGDLSMFRKSQITFKTRDSIGSSCYKTYQLII